MSNRKPVAEASEVIRAPLDKVIALVLTVHPGPAGDGNLWLLAGDEATALGQLTVSGGPERFDVHAGGQHVLYVDVDRERRTVGVQGHWWYRGEYSFDPHPEGTRMVHRVLNVAPRARWAVPFANRFFVGFRDRTSQATRSGAKRIEAQLTG